MAHWKPQRLADVVHGIEQGDYVLPVIQRRLVWDEDKMELLFDSLLKRNSFGGIMVLEEQKGSTPLFAFRPFSRYGEEPLAREEQNLSRTCSLVIDGQQRLQSFYMGLLGSFNEKTLYFDLLSTDSDYDFRFAADLGGLPTSVTIDDGSKRATGWYPVPNLFKRLSDVEDFYQVTAEITEQMGLNDAKQIERIQRNIHQFQQNVTTVPTIGIATVTVNKTEVDREKMRIVELFRRLNDGGTRLSAFDLVASMFKGFNYKMESFFRAVREFDDIHFDQDEMIKLLFLLQDEPAREAIHVKPQDAEFALQYQERILDVLRTVVKFLKTSELYNYYTSANRSPIPLYFVAYHFFHKKLSTSQLATVYENHDINNPDYLCLKRWLYLSLLNGVFSRGRGWTPYSTGIRKILHVLKQYKDAIFPVEEVLAVYTGHPLTFTAENTAKSVDTWDQDFLFYLIYNRNVLGGRDIDHIHPRSLLESRLAKLGDAAPFTMSDIHSVTNFQLLDPNSNRANKRAKELRDWLNSADVLDKKGYRQRHLIPEDPSLWQVEYFYEFLAQRRQAIVGKVVQAIPGPLLSLPPQAPKPIGKPAPASNETIGVDGPNFMLSTIKQFFDKADCGPVWASRYANGLGAMGIVTLSDFTRTIQERGLAKIEQQTYGITYRFVRPDANGEDTQPKTSAFGGWGWVTALKALEANGFSWDQYLVEGD